VGARREAALAKVEEGKAAGAGAMEAAAWDNASCK
jgi:hypothetical protein